MLRRWSAHGVVLLGLIIILLLAVTRMTGRIIDLDLWHQLALARETVRLGHVPTDDLFAFTPTVSPSVNHEWGAGMIAYAVLGAGGGLAVMILNALLAAATLSIAVVHAYRSGAKPALVAVLTLPALLLLSRGFPPVRAQAYSFILFGAFLFLLSRNRNGSLRWIAVWLPLFVLWVNLHGSFVLAFAVLGAYAVEALVDRRPVRHFVAVGAAMASLIAANPYGLAMYSHMLRTLRMARPMIPEWSAAWEPSNAASILPAMTIMIALFVYALLRAKADLAGAAVILVTAVAGCTHVKMLPYFAVGWVAFVPAWLSETPLRSDIAGIVLERKRISQAIWLLGIASATAGLIAAPLWSPRIPDADQLAFPVGPVEYLRQNRFSGHVMSQFNHGSYVIWKLYPNVKVSMDSRYDVAYPEALCYQNERAFTDERNWSGFVEKYGADAVIVERGKRLDLHIPEVRSWKRVYRDSVFSLWAREGLQLPAVDIPTSRFEGKLP